MIERHVTPLELSIKLKELGIEQKSMFDWLEFSDWTLEFNGKHTQTYYRGVLYYRNRVSAFTASELLELLPKSIEIQKREPHSFYRLKIQKIEFCVDIDKPTILADHYYISYICDSCDSIGEESWIFKKAFHANIFETNLAIACARMLIYLIEEKLYAIPEIIM